MGGTMKKLSLRLKKPVILLLLISVSYMTASCGTLSKSVSTDLATQTEKLPISDTNIKNSTPPEISTHLLSGDTKNIKGVLKLASSHKPWWSYFQLVTPENNMSPSTNQRIVLTSQLTNEINIMFTIPNKHQHTATRFYRWNHKEKSWVSLFKPSKWNDDYNYRFYNNSNITLNDTISYDSKNKYTWYTYQTWHWDTKWNLVYDWFFYKVDIKAFKKADIHPLTDLITYNKSLDETITSDNYRTGK